MQFYNFRKFYQENLNCPLLCLIDGATTYEDTQQHLMSCKTILQNLSKTTISEHTIRYKDIHGDAMYEYQKHNHGKPVGPQYHSTVLYEQKVKLCLYWEL